MKKVFVLAMLAVSAVTFAQFGQGNLVVVVAGDGGSTTGNQAASLREFTRTGSVVGNTALTGLSGRNLTISYGETSEGGLRLTGDKRFLTLGGYDLAPRSGSFNTLTTERTVARVDVNKGVTFSATFSPTVGDGVREVWSDNGSSFLATGGDLGLWGGPFNGPTSQVLAEVVSSRHIQRFNGVVYFNGSNAFNGGNGLVRLNADGTTTGLFASPGGGSGRDFAVVSENTIYYATSTGSVGLVKMVRNSTGAWSEAYRLSGTGIGHIAVDGDRVFATSSSGATLLTATDTGSGFSSWTTLATAGTNTRFRGVEFAPVPEPGTMVALGLGALAMLRRKRSK